MKLFTVNGIFTIHKTQRYGIAFISQFGLYGLENMTKVTSYEILAYISSSLSFSSES